jgi:hypothetical protein
MVVSEVGCPTRRVQQLVLSSRQNCGLPRALALAAFGHVPVNDTCEQVTRPTPVKLIPAQRLAAEPDPFERRLAQNSLGH